MFMVLEEPRKKRKSPRGEKTTKLLFTSHTGDNSEVFPDIIKLHVRPGSKVADVTYGKGVFWKKIPSKEYKLFASDLKTGVDCRKLPYANAEMDCIVLDPPYMEGLYREDDSFAGKGTHVSFQDHYSNGERPGNLTMKWHDAVLELYVQSAIEAKRVLKKNGILIVKCQDEVCAGIQRLTHIEIVLNLFCLGFYAKDLFIVTRNNRAGVTRMLKQLHARKNHSYFVVFEKEPTGSKMRSIGIMSHLLNGQAKQMDLFGKVASGAT
jgi:hypothetical protein